MLSRCPAATDSFRARGGSSCVRGDRPTAAKADRLVERASGIGVAADDGAPHTLLVQTLQAERADGGTEAAAAELRARPDRLEQPDAVLVVGPNQHIRGEASVRRLDDAVERAAVRPLGHDVAVARLGDA